MTAAKTGPPAAAKQPKGSRIACDNRSAGIRTVPKTAIVGFDVNRLVFVKAKRVDVFDFHDRVFRRATDIQR